MKIESFRDLDTWKVAMDVAERLYDIVAKLPANERFEMASQMRRAAVSVPANVAEGHAIGIRRRYLFHVRVALGSVAELSTFVELCRRFRYIDEKTAEGMQKDLSRVRQLLHGVLRNLLAQLAAKITTTGMLAFGLWLLLQ